MKRKQKLTFESLESRELLAIDGVAWRDPTHLSLSFAPDGTAIAGHSSDLFAWQNAQQSTAAWQAAILKAFQTWAAETNLDIGVRTDGGQPFGAPAPVQGDSRFGDIRIGAHGMSPDVLSVSIPHDPFAAGSWAGDVLFNSDASYVGTDLFSVALHEAGHVLGIPHSSDPNSAMYSHASARRTSLSTADIQAVQTLYGKPAPDQWDLKKSNNTLATATRIKFSQVSDGYTGATPLATFGEISRGDVDYYYLRPLLGYSGPITFRLQTAGLSLVAPKLTLLDAQGAIVATGSSTNAAGGVVKLTIAKPVPGATYYARVEGAVAGAAGLGRYALAATFDGRNTVTEANLVKVLVSHVDTLDPSDVDKAFAAPDAAFFEIDNHLDDTVATAASLKTTPGYAANSHYRMVASLSDLTDIDVYRVKSPKQGTSAPMVMTVALTANEINGTVPRAVLLDGAGVPLPTKVLANGGGRLVLQAVNLKQGDNFHVQLAPSTAGSAATGNYVLDIDFGTRAAQTSEFAVGQVSAAKVDQTGSLFVARSQLFQFLLAVDPVATATAAAVRFSIRDALGKLVFEVTARPGETVSLNSIFLAPGEYSVKFSAIAPAGLTAPAMNFRLLGSVLSEPIGPATEDPTLAPKYTSPASGSLYVYPVNVISAIPFLLYLPKK